MKNVVVFDVENVLFNVKMVEKGLKGKMYEGVGEEMERLMGLRRKLGGRLKVFVVSDFRKEMVRKLLEVNGVEVDGVYGDVGKLMNDWGFESERVVYFYGDGKMKERCELDGIKSVYCKWGSKEVEEGMGSVEGMWKEMGVMVGGVERKCDNKCEEEESVSEDEGNNIVLEDDDYKKYVGLDTVSFSWAHPGALGRCC